MFTPLRSRSFVLVLLMVCCFALPLFAQRGGGRSSGKSSSSSKSSKSTSSKTVHVKGYYRKDGTYVAPYDRAAPGSGDSPASTPSTNASPTVSSSTTVITHAWGSKATRPRSVTTSIERDKHGRIKRSESAKREFEAMHFCPSTGRAGGKCPGYVIDHVIPLACGGVDAPSNMQWQTQAAAKAKDKWERNGCR
jgi:hypothetical protein